MAAASLAPHVGVAPACRALGVPRATFYRRHRPSPGHQQPRKTPAQALDEHERERVLDGLASPRFVDRSPAEVVATLLDEGQYLCSERTMYRILAAEQPVRERRNQLAHPPCTKPELVATAPNQTWSWDITRLLGPKRWTYFSLYVLLDIFSRYVVGWRVAERESAALASRLIEPSCLKQGIEPQVLTLHSDRGAPMTSKCTAQLLADLGITRSLSRPRVSDDNPFSEAQFKTLKYHPGFPGRFADIAAATAFCRSFFPWYNTEHRHGGIAMLTPDAVHHGRARRIVEKRQRTLRRAWAQHPERFVHGSPKPPPLPTEVWSNPPHAATTPQIAQSMLTATVSMSLTGSAPTAKLDYLTTIHRDASMNAQPIRFLELLNKQVQYVVPRWQRRYCWGQSDIERLVKDLLTIAGTDPNATHYGGTLLTFQEPGPAGVVTTIRVVDGQQRLTTVSILLASIATKLGPEGKCGDWTKKIILDHRLTNPGQPQTKHRKLRLQNGDEDEYRLGLENTPTGPGAVSQAWKIARRLVDREDVGRLLTGLNRLQVVSIGLNENEDPQQIFESLNATGRALTESEKTKNWLLMGLPDAEQQDLHDNYWLRIERLLDAKHESRRTDIFLRDVLRWRTGQTHGIDRVYEGIRRWAVQSGRDRDRPALCRDLAHLAGLYGMLTGTTAPHSDAKVERELRHLRALGFVVHRPLTLRLLNDANENNCAGGGDAALAQTLAGISAWTTRMWLAGRPTAGMNKAVAELAHADGPSESADFAGHWLSRIRRLRNTRVGVPDDEDVREGIRTRNAYGRTATQTRTAFAVLCELMEAEHREESPARSRLTIEHVMPQKLTDEWRRDLGDDAEEKHGQYRNRFANLTLSGDATNSGMGANTFDAKREVYRKSPIGMTRRIADESEWNEAALERRAEDLAQRALARWPWADPSAPRHEAAAHSARLRWRIEDGPWRCEATASQMVLNVTAELLDRDPENAQRLSGEAASSALYP